MIRRQSLATSAQLHGLTPCGCSRLDSSNVRRDKGRARTSMQAAASDIMPVQSIKVVPQPRITPEGKAQADSNAQQARHFMSISRGLQHHYRGSDGVAKLLLQLMRFSRWQIVRSAAMLLAVAATTLLGTHTAGADIIHFKDGMRTVCQGKAWEEKDEVRCEYDGGVLIYPKADVETIERRPSACPSRSPS